MVTPAEYRTLTRNPDGAKLRQFFNGACNRNMGSRSLSDLDAQLEEMGVPEARRQTLVARYKDLNTHAVNRTLPPFQLRGVADEVALGTLVDLEKADDLHGESAHEKAVAREAEARAAEEAAVESAARSPVDKVLDGLQVTGQTMGGKPVYGWTS